MKGELRLVRRRMRQRWLATIVAALVVTGALVAWKALHVPTYRASIVVRLVEESFDEETRPPTARDITQYLYDIALSRPTLLAVIEEHGLYPERSFDPTWAVESMKDDIDIDVVSNYFSPETYIENPLREARVVISYNAREPRQALEVVRELGDLIAERERAVRQRIAALTAQAGNDAKQALRDQLLLAQRELTVLELERAKTPIEIVRIRHLIDEITVLDRELKIVSRTAGELSLRGAFEAEAMGLRFEVVDNGKLPKRLLTRAQSLGLLGIVAFLLALPVVGVGVMALDTRIHDRDSVARLGIALLGTVSAHRRGRSPDLPHRRGSE